MENTHARLLLLKAQLYALLAALGGLLLILVLFVSVKSAPAPMIDSRPDDGPAHRDGAASPMVVAGKDLFLANCASCHNKNMKDNLTGPALEGVENRWAAYPRKDLYNWIRHSQQLIRSGHPRAQELWKAHRPAIMNDFPGLTDMQIEQLLAYIER